MALTKISGSILKDPLNIGEVSIGGTLTYQDVTNVDSIGLGTFRSGINVSGGQLDVGSNIKLGNAGIITATELDISGDIDVDGHTELDNVNIAGIVTVSSDGINAGILDLKTGGNIRLRFSSGGTAQFRGDTDPIASFDRGSANSTNVKWGYLGADRGIISSISNEFRITASGTTPMTFHSNGSERLRIRSDGGVGIGTENNFGGSTLSIYGADIGEGTAKGQLVIKDTAAYNASPTAGILFQGIHAAGSQAIFAGIRGFKENASDGNYAGALAFDVRAHGAVAYEALRITSAGKIGIGTNTVTDSNVFVEVVGSASQKARLQFDNKPVIGSNGGEIGGILFRNNSDSVGYISCLRESAADDGYLTFGTQATGGGVTERLRIASDGNIGINQTSPQALLHIGNYETTQNVQQSTVTQYFIDSTRSLKIARQSAGNVTTNAAWYTVATLALGGFSYRCQVSLGGNFTQDVVDIEIQTAYGTGLNNKYSFQMTGKAACAHNNNRITKARVTTGGLLQVWIGNGVDSNTTAKVVLETTCGIYAQNAADNAYPMPIVVDSSSPSIITNHLLNFGVHAQWSWTINSSSVRSYTRLSGSEFCGQVNAGNGSNQGVNNTFNAPMDGLYHCDFSVASISASANNNCLISMYGSMTYDSQNNITTNQEVYDPRGCGAATQPQQGSGFSTVFKMAKGDYFTFDFYRPGGGNGYTDGGGQGFDIAVHKIQ